MSRVKELRDLAIQMGISGSEDLNNLGCCIENDYFRRERRENFYATLISIKVPVVKRTDVEIALWKHDKQLAELEAERVNKKMEEYPVDETDVGYFLPKGVIVETI